MEILFSLSINKYKVLSIFWNVFLAVVPCLTVYAMSLSAGKRKWARFSSADRFAFVTLFLFWLFTLPNTAYLFSISRHLVNYCMDYDKFRVCREGSTWIVLFFFLYSLVGIPTFYYALKKMAVLTGKVFDKRFLKWLPAVFIPPVALAVMYGLFERFNSWDVLLRPFSLLYVAGSYFTDAVMLLNFLVITSVLYLIYYGIDVLTGKLPLK